jgi:hypothetical protein
MPRVFLLLALLLLGPRETLAGKFPGHAPEYLERYPAATVPLPDPLPADVDALCRLVEAGHGTAAVHAALGEALLARGEKGLAYRAFHEAQRQGAPGMQERKERCGYVDPLVIGEEKRVARVWVAALMEYERDRIRRGEDPRDLGPFHERYGRAEDDLGAIAQARRKSWAVAVAAGLLGAAAVLGAVLFVRKRA